MTINPTSFHNPSAGSNSQAVLTSPTDPVSAFDTADTSKNGGIEEIEVRSFLRNLGYTDAQIDTAIAGLFTNGKTSLDRAEFDALLSNTAKLPILQRGNDGLAATQIEVARQN